MNSKQKNLCKNIIKRHKAEKRFLWYGRIAILISFSILCLLIANLLLPAISGFQKSVILLPINSNNFSLSNEEIKEYGIKYEGDTNIKYLARDVLLEATYRKSSQILKESLQKIFPNINNKIDLYNLISSGAILEIRQFWLDGKNIKNIWLTASDKVDSYMKNHRSTVNDNQIKMIKLLQKEGKIKKIFNIDFFSSGDSRNPEQAGFLSAIIGSILTMIICLAVSFPLGVGAAIYLEEFSKKNRLHDIIEVNINNLAAVPSIIFGLLGLAVYLNFFGMPRSAPLVGGLTLALMTLPIIIITTRTSIQAVPDSIRQASFGIGASPLQTVFHHILPLAMPGIMTGAILGAARAIGETAPLLMIGMVAFIADIPNKFTDVATVMPVQIYIWASSPEVGFVDKTASAIIVLIISLFAMNGLAIYLRKKYEHKW